MATVTEDFANREKLSWFLDHCAHNKWDRFSAQEQRRMVHDDLSAGRNVSLILISLITAGLILTAVTLCVVIAGS